MKKLIPLDSNDCQQLIRQYNNEIRAGKMDIQIKSAHGLTYEDLKFLVQYCPTSYDVLGRYEGLPSDLLITLARYPDAVNAVASNKNTPVNILEAFAKNNLAIKELVKNPNTPELIIDSLIDNFIEDYYHKEYELCCLAKRHDLSAHIAKKLVKLLYDTDSYLLSNLEKAVQELVIPNPKKYLNAILIFAKHNPYAKGTGRYSQNADKFSIYQNALHTILRDPNTSRETLKLFEDTHMRISAANHPNAPPITLDDLKNKDIYGLSLIASNRNTPSAILEKLALESNEPEHSKIRSALASNPNLGQQIVIDMFIRSNDIDTLSKIASSRNTSSEILEKLADDSINFKIRCALSENPITPPNILDKLARNMKDMCDDPDTKYTTMAPDGAIRSRTAYHPNTSPSTIEFLFDIGEKGYKGCWGSPSYRTHRNACQSIASHSATPAHILQRLAKHHDEEVRLAILKNPNADEKIKKIAKNYQKSCYIATATYGTSTAKEIDILRTFRDDILLKYTSGRIFINLYYRLSPPLANQITKHTILKKISLHLLIKPILRLINSYNGKMKNNI